MSDENTMKILVVGSGGREHALVWSLIHTSQRPLKVFCAPGNAGITELAGTVDIDAIDIGGLADFAATQEIDLTIVGGEAALAAGIADEFARRNLLIAAPTRNAARLESSKSFAKSFMTRHGIPTAHHRTVASLEAARECLRSGEFGNAETPVVVKADGLAAGKGVHVTASHAEALLRVEELMNANAHPASSDISSAVVVLEEKLEGAEVSLLLWTDGRDYILMPPARDHKRIGENDTGANTGGMGVITSHDILDAATLEEIKRTIVEPTLHGAREEGFAFRGVLYIGLMLTAGGARVIEYNARPGDPETQAILVRLKSDLVEIFQAVAHGRLREVNVEWSEDASVCVVLAARGYPNKPEIGHVIEGLETFDVHDDVRVFHAATTRRDNQWLTAGGRVLGVTATAAHLDDALAKCYDAVARIKWDGMNYRRDIGRFKGDDAVAPRKKA
ncbi:MAG: phosphoribosylamine--glycine ligase [Pyrinomonadaceae bacterium MAG19_C2-C3]|nr:phosphoribosylamine--glycine ligase [Pyrinomonadaceae bacterium MAG19_C2-C3]